MCDFNIFLIYSVNISTYKARCLQLPSLSKTKKANFSFHNRLIIIPFLIILCFTAWSLKSLHNFESPRHIYKLQFFCSEYEKCKYDRTKMSLQCNACKNQTCTHDSTILWCHANSHNIRSSLWSQDGDKLHEKIAVKELIQNAIIFFFFDNQELVLSFLLWKQPWNCKIDILQLRPKSLKNACSGAPFLEKFHGLDLQLIMNNSFRFIFHQFFPQLNNRYRQNNLFQKTWICRIHLHACF